LVIGGCWTARVETRIPFWHDSRAVIIEDYLEHPENYRAHVRVGFVFAQTGDTVRALREYLWAAELYPPDAVVTVQAGAAAMATGQTAIALREARRGWTLAPGDPVIAERLSATLAWAGDTSAAIAAAAAGRARRAGAGPLEARYLELRQARGVDAWWEAVLVARIAWLEGRASAATERLGAAAAQLSSAPPQGACDDLRDGAELARNLLVEGAERLATGARSACSGN
jgi:predicted Zn-dependent protease